MCGVSAPVSLPLIPSFLCRIAENILWRCAKKCTRQIHFSFPPNTRFPGAATVVGTYCLLILVQFICYILRLPKCGAKAQRNKNKKFICDRLTKTYFWHSSSTDVHRARTKNFLYLLLSLAVLHV